MGYKIAQSPGGVFSHAVYRSEPYALLWVRWVYLHGFDNRDAAIAFIQNDAISRAPTEEFFTYDGRPYTWAD